MKTLIALVFLLIPTLSFCKDSVKDYPFLNSKQKAVVKLINGDAFNATVDFERLPAFVEITKEGDKKGESLYANNFSWIKIDTMVFVPIKYRPDETTSKNYSIVQLLDTGKINLYRYFSFDEVLTGSNSMAKRNSFSTCLILKKEGLKYGNTDANTFISFKNGVERYIKDYPELNTKVQDKEKGYKRDDLENIITEYNVFYSEKEKQLQEQKEKQEKEKQEAERARLKEELRQEILKEMEEVNSEKEKTKE